MYSMPFQVWFSFNRLIGCPTTYTKACFCCLLQMLSPERIVNELSSYFGDLAVAVKVHVFECRGGHLLFWGRVLPYNVKYNGIL